jgi:outer membrane protein OmpA-like peptidoglycan-associated protein
MKPLEKSRKMSSALPVGAALAMALAAFCTDGVAQQAPATTQVRPAQLLEGDQITEQNVIAALAPVPPEVRTRSLRLHSEAAQAPAAAGSAALLITFVTGSARLTEHARDQLDIVARALQSEQLAPLRFIVEGHADPRGTVEGNQVLSLARAQSVCEYLVQARGVDEGRLSAVGKGSSEPLNTANPIAPENRRVTILTNLN